MDTGVARSQEAEPAPFDQSPVAMPLGLPNLEIGRERDWYFIAEQSAPAPHLTHPEGRAALRMDSISTSHREEDMKGTTYIFM